MNRTGLTVTTAITPVLWGTTYLTTTELLPPHHPLFNATLRALPVGLLITMLLRQLPSGIWWARASLLGALNIGISFAMLFIAAYRLPGGVAATMGAIQPIVVVLLCWPLLGLRPSVATLLAGAVGVTGVAMLMLGSHAALDMIGIAAVGVLVVTMAFGVVLAKRWGRPAGVSVLAFTGWQLVAGGLILAPCAALFEGAPRALSLSNAGGYLYLGLVGTGLAYTLWFRGIDRLSVTSVSFLGLLNPLVATIAGFLAYRQSLTLLQLAGMVLVLGSILVTQRPARRPMVMDAPPVRRRVVSAAAR
jgi:probable blue pigment (indigoidine) exporter